MDKISSITTLLLCSMLLTAAALSSQANAQKRGRHAPNARPRTLNRVDAKQAEARLAEMGYGSGRTALTAFQKYEGRDVTGVIRPDDFDAIMNARAPQARDAGYKHVEVDLDRQFLLLTDD